MKLLLALAAVALAGCPKKTTTEPGANVTCDNVGASIATELAEAAKAAPTPEPNVEAMNNAMVAAVIESCQKDAWSGAARACFVEARTESSERCKTEITDAQFLALDDRMDSAAAKVSPAECSELEPLITESLTKELEHAAPDERATLEAKIAPFASSVGAMCTAGWSVEARTCVRDATRAGLDAGRCARWLDEPQKKAYQSAVEQAFGAPPPGAGSGAGSGS